MVETFHATNTGHSTELRQAAEFGLPLFWRFWESVAPQSKKINIILNYEVAMTRKLQDAGFACRAFFEPSYVSRVGHALRSAVQSRSLYRFLKAFVLPQVNYTIVAPMQLLSGGVPMIKREVLRSNPARVNLEDLKPALLALNSDLAEKIPELNEI